MTSTDQELMQAYDAGDGEAACKRAILNILDDLGEERFRQVEDHRAVVNLLEDLDTERIRLESTQRALVNILDDVNVERTRAQEVHFALRSVNEAMQCFLAVAGHGLRSSLTLPSPA